MRDRGRLRTPQLATGKLFVLVMPQYTRLGVPSTTTNSSNRLAQANLSQDRRNLGAATTTGTVGLIVSHMNCIARAVLTTQVLHDLRWGLQHEHRHWYLSVCTVSSNVARRPIVYL